MVSGQIEAAASDRISAVACEDIEALPDEHLLEKFLDGSGEEAEIAFRAVVVRHGPMVLGVCRHVLGQQQDAEDAFQATFLVLARKASSIHDRRVLGRWLYEVAYRIALRAKTGVIRRRTHERQGAEMLVEAPETEAGWNELRPVLHEEVNRLPEKYRTPVILCYLEGKTNEEVARLLQWPVGTVKGRLSRARELLRARLTRRGLALSAAFLLVALSRNSVIAETVPSTLIDATVESALRLKGLPPAADADPTDIDLSEPLHPSPKFPFLGALGSKYAFALRVALLAAVVLGIGEWLTGAWNFAPGAFTPRISLNSILPILGPPASGGSCHSSN
jgi:RNA polymerase sigma factor (sigma-70 family)